MCQRKRAQPTRPMTNAAGAHTASTTPRNCHSRLGARARGETESEREFKQGPLRGALIVRESGARFRVSRCRRIRQKHQGRGGESGRFGESSKNPLITDKTGFKVVAQTGIEPVTQGFSVLCSTN